LDDRGLAGFEETRAQAEERLLALASMCPTAVGRSLRTLGEHVDTAGLDPRTYALIGVAALAALDAPTASWRWQVGFALESGATVEDLVNVLVALAPTIGAPRVVAASRDLAEALELLPAAER
jgi:alkylhydroperoxidase/carboxymuconolactone decarboxylase family protein YurZ